MEGWGEGNNPQPWGHGNSGCALEQALEAIYRVLAVVFDLPSTATL